MTRIARASVTGWNVVTVLGKWVRHRVTVPDHPNKRNGDHHMRHGE